MSCFLGCSEDSENTEQYYNSKSLTGNLMLSPGQIHNNGLEALYYSVIEHGNTQDVNTTLDALDSAGRHHFISETVLNLSNAELDLYTESLNYHQVGRNPDISMVSAQLQTELEKLFIYLDDVIDDSNTNAGQEIFDYSRELLIVGAPSNLSKSDQIIWRGAVDVMGYTASYWYDNAVKWENAFSNGSNTVQAKGWFGRLWKRIKNVVAADVGGFIAGAAYGIITGATGVLVVGASYAVGSSAGAAVKEILF